MNHIISCIAGVLCVCGASVGAPRSDFDRLLPVEAIAGTVRVVAVGGVETPTRRAVSIGERRFELVGARERVDALFEAEGHEVTVRGVVNGVVVIGGEGWPVLTLLAVERVCKCLPEATPGRVSRLAAARVLEFVSAGGGVDMLAPPRVLETRVVGGSVLVALERHLTSDPIPLRREVRWFEYRVDEDAVTRVSAPSR